MSMGRKAAVRELLGMAKDLLAVGGSKAEHLKLVKMTEEDVGWALGKMDVDEKVQNKISRELARIMARLGKHAGKDSFLDEAENAVGELRSLGDDHGVEEDVGGAMSHLEDFVYKGRN